MANKVLPISPDEVTHEIPDFIFDAVNQLIKERWNGHDARILQKDIVARVLQINPQSSKDEIFDRHWLDIEQPYRKAGWQVKYDKPGYGEDYEAYFEFKKTMGKVFETA